MGRGYSEELVNNVIGMVRSALSEIDPEIAVEALWE